jgi:chromosome partitioning protein
MDCPPSLGPVTKNGLRISTGYIIPTVPDILSTWGIFPIVQHIAQLAADLERPIPALGIVATRVQKNALHERVLGELRTGRLGRFLQHPEVAQPHLFEALIPQSVDVARAADFIAGPRTLITKYGDASKAYSNLTKEILNRCETKKPS